MIRSLIRKKFPASRLALSIGLGSSLFALNVGAQTDSSAPATTPPNERIQIIGSNIPSSEEVGTAPVDTVDQAARDRTGQEDVLTVLTASTPAISSGGGNLGQSNASINSGATYGASAIAIHGLPTLVLLNGRRLTDSSAAAAGGGTFTDVNLFPSALVKRIEILKDGASAIYGTEAIGGVVNVILDSEFQGFEFSARYGFTEKSNVQDKRYDAIFGIGDDKTHLVVGGEYVEQDPLFTRDRDFTIGGGTGVTTTAAGIVRIRTTPAQASGTYFILNPALNSPNDVTAPGSVPLPTTAAPNGATTGGFPAGTYTRSSAGAVSQTIDLRPYTSITLDQNRLNAFASADRELFGKYVVAFADFLYASNYTQSYLAAQPVNNLQSYSGGLPLVIPAGAPFNPFNGTITNSVANQIVTSSNRLALPANVQVNDRFLVGPNPQRVFRNDADFYRIVAGLKGEIIPNYNYEVAMNSSREALSFKNFGLVVGDNLNRAIAGGYAPVAGQPGKFVAQPATFDAAGNVVTPAGPYSFVNGNYQPALDPFARVANPASLVGVFGTDERFLETKFDGVDGKITAFPINLPAGPLGVAAGGEWRHEKLRANFSPEGFLGSVPGADINVGRDVTSGFLEVQIPIIGPDMHIPGVYSLDLDGAGRFEDYDPGNSTWVPKVGFVYRPIKDIALRGTFSKSFIAPTLFETNGPTTSGFTSSINLGAGNEQAQSLSGSTASLSNQRADTYTAGIVVSPHQVPGLTLNCDFFHVEDKGQVGTISTATILTSVNAAGPASPLASFVHFGSFTGPGVTAPGQLVGNLPQYFVVANEQNLGGARIGGIDFGAHYNHDFGVFGAVNIGIDATYYLQYKVSEFNNSQFYDVIGYYTGQASEVAPYHLTPSVEYKWKGFTASALGNYTPSVRDAHNVNLDPTPSLSGYNGDKPYGGFLGQNPGATPADAIANGYPKTLSKIRDYYTIDLLFSYEFGLNKPVDAPMPPAPKDGKDGGKQVVARTEAKKMMSFHWFDGLKLAFGINNVTNARPPLIQGSPDSTNTDAAIYDPYQRRYYFVITKKF